LRCNFAGLGKNMKSLKKLSGLWLNLLRLVARLKSDHDLLAMAVLSAFATGAVMIALLLILG
jgi:hypothetical protein